MFVCIPWSLFLWRRISLIIMKNKNMKYNDRLKFSLIRNETGFGTSQLLQRCTSIDNNIL